MLKVLPEKLKIGGLKDWDSQRVTYLEELFVEVQSFV